MELEHFSHPHPLMLKEQLGYDGDEVVCSGCEEPIWGPFYSCLSCYFFLHKRCFELPVEIKHHLHPQHPLLLLAKPPPSYKGSCACDVCNKICKSFVYHCSLCKFDLDINCAFPPCLFEANGQGHQFKCLLPSIPLKFGTSFTCNACGTDGDDSPFVCHMCLLMVHEKCISVPSSIKKHINRHPPMEHTYFLGQGRSVKQYCGICREEIRAGFGGYSCPHCEYVAHVSCSLAFEASRFECKDLAVNYFEVIKEPVAYAVREIKQGTETVIIEIKQFSHQHNLILMHEIKRDLKCDGCMFPIFSPYYGCTECNFFMDNYCIGLHKHIKLSHYAKIMPLISKAFTSDGVFCCDICKQYRQGFSYIYNHEYRTTFDIRCITFMRDFIEHGGH